MSNKPHAGFTLIELLMVVAIIALLAAMLMPVIGSVRAAAKKVVCAGQLRQIGLAFATYSGENRNRVPYGFSIGGSMGCWEDIVLVTLDVFPDFASCWAEKRRSQTRPDRPFPGKFTLGVCPSKDRWFLDESTSFVSTNYSINWPVMGTVGAVGYPNFSLSYFKSQARILMTVDGQFEPSGNGNYSIAGLAWVTFTDPHCVIDLRHNRQANALYLDTHIETISATSTFVTDFN